MIEITYDGAGEDPAAEALIRRSVTEALKNLCACGDVTVLLTDEEGIQTLNRTYRHVDAVTDVLTFPAWEGESIAAPPDGYLGDIAVCRQRAEEQAVAYGHPLNRELAFLCVHGALHLCGYDHMTPEDEKRMFAKQDEILNGMGLTR